MKIIIFLFVFICTLQASAQKNKQVSVAFISAATANPFSQFGKLVTDIKHPGVEFGYSINWKTKPKHDWYQEIKLAYFYHRFVQHAIPLYTDLGYRYKFLQRWTTQASIGAGYMHSIPATAQLKLQDNGEYKKGKGFGRMQAIAVLNIGLSHIFNPASAKPINVFLTWQQMLQMPFIKAYVPVLPYNNLLIGIGIHLTAKK